MSDWTISLQVLCSKCRQWITEPDLTKNNYQLILLPVLTIHHQVCPCPSPEYPSQCAFTYSQDIPEQINLNINLK